jgi:hypothetical protein
MLFYMALGQTRTTRRNRKYLSTRSHQQSSRVWGGPVLSGAGATDGDLLRVENTSNYYAS